jgi:hypothetical protein
MTHYFQTAKRILVTSATAFFISTLSVPALTWADTAPSPTPTPASSSDVSSSTPPASPDGTSYSFNSATGLWESDAFTWNPATGQTAPKVPQDYSYNPTTGHWDSTQWRYNPTTNTYVPNTPAPTPTPTPTPTVTPQSSSDSSSTSTPALGTAQPMLASVLPTPTPSLSSGVSQSGVFDSFYNAAISNVLVSNATSGNAVVLGNTTGGDATSGNATAIANVINLLQSAASLTGGNLSTFTSNINGDVNGNLLLDPAQISALQAATPSDVTQTTINTATNQAINNTIALHAASGDATVASNTSAGNATSGNANAVADVVNLINSIIAAKQSFLGVINIYGNLNGNITVPADFVNSLLADNGSSGNTGNAGGVTSADTTAVANAITTAAASGNATVSGNTTAGNATSGQAANQVTILNLTNRTVVAANSLLVFVNVLGNWIGLIMDAPAGTSAAALGGGVTSSIANLPASVTSTTNNHITNTIGLSATSGSATVSNNTSAGNARSGNATTSANLANITGSQFGLSNWFGILFINVFGSWLGNFGVQPIQTAAAGNANGVPSAVFQFVPSGQGSPADPTYHLARLWQSGTGGAPGAGSTALQNTILAAQKSPVLALTARGHRAPAVGSVTSGNTNLAVAAAIVSVGLFLFALDAFRRYRHHRSL